MSGRPFDQNVPGTPSEPEVLPQAPPPAAPVPPVSTTPVPPVPVDHSEEQSTGDVAKQEAASVGRDVKDSAGQVAQTAKEEVRQVADEAKGHVQSLLSQVSSDVSGQARDQQQRAAEGLHGLADEFSQMAENSQGSGMASGLVSQAAGRLDGVAGWLEGREPADLLDDVKRYARRNPGTFLAVCGLVGLVGGRLTRSLREDATQDQYRQHGGGGYATAGQTTYQPVADAGVYATTPGVPTAYATREQTSTFDTLAEPLPVGDELIAQDDELIGRDEELLGQDDELYPRGGDRL